MSGEKRDREEYDDDGESEKENDENPTKKLKLEKKKIFELQQRLRGPSVQKRSIS